MKRHIDEDNPLFNRAVKLRDDMKGNKQFPIGYLLNYIEEWEQMQKLFSGGNK